MLIYLRHLMNIEWLWSCMIQSEWNNLGQRMVLYRVGNKPLSEPLLAYC